jgi:hypothetical protein
MPLPQNRCKTSSAAQASRQLHCGVGCRATPPPFKAPHSCTGYQTQLYVRCTSCALCVQQTIPRNTLKLGQHLFPGLEGFVKRPSKPQPTPHQSITRTTCGVQAHGDTTLRKALQEHPEGGSKRPAPQPAFCLAARRCYCCCDTTAAQARFCLAACCRCWLLAVADGWWGHGHAGRTGGDIRRPGANTAMEGRRHRCLSG